MQRRTLSISVTIVLAVVIAAFSILFTCDYFLLWKPSHEGRCGGFTLNSPAPARPHLARFRGQVVGKNLWILQYRWLRRRFKAVGTTLSLVRDLPSSEYKGNIVLHGERVRDVVIDNFGRFDFGDLTPGEYDLSVIFPGEDAVGFGFVIDPSAHSTEVLIDASPPTTAIVAAGISRLTAPDVDCEEAAYPVGIRLAFCGEVSS
jgi:hypothetical protein